MGWSSVATGSLATGDCAGKVLLWDVNHAAAGTCHVRE